jgi:membrane-bound ClpP family serine protease
MDQKEQDVKLDIYYKLNRLHLQFSFWSSLGALITGLIILVAGVRLIFLGAEGLTGQLVTIGGIVTQFIGAGFFLLYSKNLKQLNIFYEKIIRHQDTLYAMSLATHHLTDERKADAIGNVISMLLTRNEPKTPMSAEMMKVITDAMQAERASKV